MTLNKNPMKQLTVVQGEAHASVDPAITFNTILGSCVATCLFDPVSKVGGMNHFLLAEPLDHDAQDTFDGDYGLFLMELLVNEMLKLGARKRNMKARLYGGANMNSNLGPIGAVNAAFARDFLKREGITLGFADLEGTCARRVEFRPATGQVRVRKITSNQSEALATQKPSVPRKRDLGTVELF